MNFRLHSLLRRCACTWTVFRQLQQQYRNFQITHLTISGNITTGPLSLSFCKGTLFGLSTKLWRKAKQLHSNLTPPLNTASSINVSLHLSLCSSWCRNPFEAHKQIVFHLQLFRHLYLLSWVGLPHESTGRFLYSSLYMSHCCTPLHMNMFTYIHKYLRNTYIQVPASPNAVFVSLAVFIYHVYRGTKGPTDQHSLALSRSKVIPKEYNNVLIEVSLTCVRTLRMETKA
jgi:hypothetical protein